MDDWDDEGFSMPFSEEDDGPPAEGTIESFGEDQGGNGLRILLANMVVIVVMLRSWVSTTNLIPVSGLKEKFPIDRVKSPIFRYHKL